MFVIDLFLKPLLTSEAEIERELKFYAPIEKLRGMSTGQLVWEYLDIIDAKASALLTHISIFAALAGLLYTSESDGTWEKNWLGAEFVAMGLIAIICLRCLRTLSADSRAKAHDEEDASDFWMHEGTKELIYRRKLFAFYRESVSFLAIAVIITEIVSFFGV
ncbi:MAG: hypothetical protein ABJH45_13450 [Paracoccaceae bacterium]|uniref:hypothetical protein n=1 Tax=Shimia thalassica TaxID=1715693 RepID=UPI003297C85C